MRALGAAPFDGKRSFHSSEDHDRIFSFTVLEAKAMTLLEWQSLIGKTPGLRSQEKPQGSFAAARTATVASGEHPTHRQ